MSGFVPKFQPGDCVGKENSDLEPGIDPGKETYTIVLTTPLAVKVYGIIL